MTAAGSQAGGRHRDRCGGIVRTVCGDRTSDDFQGVAVHEHLVFDLRPPEDRGFPDVAITPQDRWQIDYLSNATPGNACQHDAAIAAEELEAFSRDGGDLLVDQSVSGIGRDPAALRQASRASGCAVIAAAGTYTAPFLDEVTASWDIETLSQRFTAEVTTGIDATTIRAGLIGEIGCSWPLEPVERRALIAAARAAQVTGAGLSVHPGRHPRAPFEIVDILERAGADLPRVAICHMDRTYPDGVGPLELARTGVMVEWDFFGVETSHYWMGDVELPTDRMRIRAIRAMFDAGMEDRVLISQDICTRSRLKRWGGHGYGHILRNVPTLMSLMGFTPDEIIRLTRTNPLRLLTMPQETAG